MKKIVYLILHYITIDETMKCVDSIKKYNKKGSYDIVIVDNGSYNKSGEELLKHYKKEKDIHIIISKENLGFARGNNLGFKYIKDNFNPEFIVMLNNDVYLLSNEFSCQIIEEYNNSNFAVLGPKIFLKDNNICNFPDKIQSNIYFKKKRIENIILYYFNKLNIRCLFSLYLKLKNVFVKKERINCDIWKEDVMLNGCCLIFSKEYINKFDGIDDRTFLYYEEQLLYLRLKKNNLKSIYNPKIEVFHNEGVSTNKKTKNKKNRFDFVLKHEIDSLNVLIQEIEKWR